MTLNSTKLVEIFVESDDFLKDFESYCRGISI